MSIVSLIRRDKKKSKRNAQIAVLGAVLSIILITVGGKEEPTETTTVVENDAATQTATEVKTEEKSNEPTDEEWQESFKRIALSEAQAYIELTVKGTITPENHESRTKVLLSQAEKITGSEKETFKELAEAVKSDDLATSKELYIKLGGEDFPELTKEVQAADYTITFPSDRYPETALHIKEAIADGHSATCTIDRSGAEDNRDLSLKGVPTVEGKDRDEWPMAMCAEGGIGADIKHISPKDNRGAGSWVGHKLSDYPDGTRIQFKVE
ncbi:hypothetical protein B2I21_07545 [Chryseobacterium mucoviscidosis]|nr:hypothetical protein B2I21_07545 [Chryseobacterium mucoviscidosis]